MSYENLPTALEVACTGLGPCGFQERFGNLGQNLPRLETEIKAQSVLVMNRNFADENPILVVDPNKHGVFNPFDNK